MFHETTQGFSPSPPGKQYRTATTRRRPEYVLSSSLIHITPSSHTISPRTVHQEDHPSNTVSGSGNVFLVGRRTDRHLLAQDCACAYAAKRCIPHETQSLESGEKNERKKKKRLTDTCEMCETCNGGRSRNRGQQQLLYRQGSRDLQICMKPVRPASTEPSFLLLAGFDKRRVFVYFFFFVLSLPQRRLFPATTPRSGPLRRWSKISCRRGKKKKKRVNRGGISFRPGHRCREIRTMW